MSRTIQDHLGRRGPQQRLLPIVGLDWRRRKQEKTRRQQLVDGYVAALGGSARISPIQLQDIERCVDLVMLAKTARAELAAGGKTSINDVVKL